MRWRTVLALYVACGGLAVWYRTLAPVAPPGPSTGGPPARPAFLAVASDDVQALTIARQDRRVVARRTADGWELVEPRGARVPHGLLTAFVDALAASEEIEEVAVGTYDPGAFGFGATSTRVAIERTTGAPLVLELGGANPNGTAVYARREDGARVVLVGRMLRYYEELLFGAVPTPEIPADAQGQVGSRDRPPDARGRG